MHLKMPANAQNISKYMLSKPVSFQEDIKCISTCVDQKLPMLTQDKKMHLNMC
jgi:hypothetical protein